MTNKDCFIVVHWKAYFHLLKKKTKRKEAVIFVQASLWIFKDTPFFNSWSKKLVLEKAPPGVYTPPLKNQKYEFNSLKNKLQNLGANSWKIFVFIPGWHFIRFFQNRKRTKNNRFWGETISRAFEGQL